MIILTAVLLTILIICDVVLVKYCKVKNGFRMFAFRIFTILLLLLFLIITGDIQIAYGARIDDFPVFHKQIFVTYAFQG